MEQKQLPEFLICHAKIFRILRVGVRMQQGKSAGRIVRFGSFEAFQEGKLTKAGIRPQEQPLLILALMLERPGQPAQTVDTAPKIKKAHFATLAKYRHLTH